MPKMSVIRRVSHLLMSSTGAGRGFHCGDYNIIYIFVREYLSLGLETFEPFMFLK